MSLSNPLNLLLLPPILYTLYLIFFPTPTRPTTIPHLYAEEHYNWAPAKHPEVICYKKFTPLELKKYDGVDGGRILLAIIRTGVSGKIPPRENEERTVFDVSSGRGFYGPDGMYGNFAGRDASRGMAKQSFDDDVLTPLDAPLDSLEDLTVSEIENMRGWHEHFERKYPIVGELVEA